jgi:hypothetical protein
MLLHLIIGYNNQKIKVPKHSHPKEWETSPQKLIGSQTNSERIIAFVSIWTETEWCNPFEQHTYYCQNVQNPLQLWYLPEVGFRGCTDMQVLGNNYNPNFWFRIKDQSTILSCAVGRVNNLIKEVGESRP